MQDEVLHPDNDGITHLNFYTRARTSLGRLGSNLADTPIRHPVHGSFRTLEGLWYFLRTGMKDDIFRAVSGYDAKKIGKSMEKVWNAQFNREFKLGILAKVEQHPDIRYMLLRSNLPLVHYYFFGKVGGPLKIVKPQSHEWQMKYWTEVREAMQAGKSFKTLQQQLLLTLGLHHDN